MSEYSRDYLISLHGPPPTTVDEMALAIKKLADDYQTNSGYYLDKSEMAEDLSVDLEKLAAWVRDCHDSP
jgi:hypothetical protein